jgi:hypothetical protein
MEISINDALPLIGTIIVMFCVIMTGFFIEHMNKRSQGKII